MLRLGYKASAEQFGPRELIEFSVIAEEVGFDSVMVSDHFQPWRSPGRTDLACCDWHQRRYPDFQAAPVHRGAGNSNDWRA
jgi:alkanesulfonate monooxygenase SsuD/methylene tetrahydromethanopterin reductase-like flavin-dependent oxidoreductase (luciferase family)